MDAVQIPVVAMEVLGKQGAVALHEFTPEIMPVPIKYVHLKSSDLDFPVVPRPLI
jgi:hypothetical protein